MAQPVLRRGEWWYEQPDGSWLRWNEGAGTWEQQAVPPPPPTPTDSPPPLPETMQAAPVAEAAPAGQPEAQAPAAQSAVPEQVAPSPIAQGAPAASQEAVGPGMQARVAGSPQPAVQETGALQASQHRAPAGHTPGTGLRGGNRPPVDQLIVPESYVIETQQRTSGVVAGAAPPEIRIEHVAPNVTRVETPQTGNVQVQVAIDPRQQVAGMAALKLSDNERSVAGRQMTVLAGILAPGERLVGLAAGTENATGHWGLVAVTDRQVMFVGQPSGETQLVCPLDAIELVGYEDLGGLARLSVTAGGRVTTWRDVPTMRAAEIAQLVENRGAMARAVAPPVSAAPGIAAGPPIGTAVSDAQPAAAPASVVSAGEVAVYRSTPSPSEIYIPEAQPAAYQPPTQPGEDQDTRSKVSSFFRDLFNDPGARMTPRTAGRTGPSIGSPGASETMMMLRLSALGSIAVALASLALRWFAIWVVAAALAVGLGYWVYQQNRRRLRDQLTEGMAAAGIIIGAVSLALAILWYF